MYIGKKVLYLIITGLNNKQLKKYLILVYHIFLINHMNMFGITDLNNNRL